MTSISSNMNRRRFLVSATATVACAGATTIPEEVKSAPMPEVITIGPRERPPSDIESWNLGLITASRPELSPDENEARNRELFFDLSHFGRLHVRGRYCARDGSPPIEERAWLVTGWSDDSGNLKGALRKLGRKYEQDAVIHKGYYRDAELHALKDLPDLGMADKEKKILGRFHPNRVGLYYVLMTKRAGSPLPSSIEQLHNGFAHTDWLGGRWEDIGFWMPGSFFSRHERRVYFDDAGNRVET